MSTVTSPDGTVIDYDSHGDGPAVILIGGATQHRAIDERTTRAARLLAAEGFTAVDYDRRGRGRSGDTAPWALEREVEDVAALVEAAGGSAGLYSSSSGATVALAAASAGIGVTSLALYEPPLFPGADHTEHLAELRALLAADKLDDAMRYNMTAVIGLPAEAVAGMAHSPGWPAMVAVARTLVYDLAAVHDVNLDPDWRRRWAGVTVPTIVYSGDRTFPGLPEAADTVVAAIPHSRRRILPGQDHGPAPEAIVPVLLEFLRG
ncbi:alpha/beta fold hydrolase [Pseudonocardia acaciae]|uniref:alpha/beta fold hydrolase n=1 Tax=Pseudonocardia acaciae TaxID=551276 RepID=UPI0004916BF2|nr:alpha/beta hydrolase [Pseudonocardia acaciae]